MVERFNRTLQDMLTTYVNSNQSDWDIYLPSMLFAYRMCTHSTTGQSPYFLMYVREPNMPIDLDYLPTISQYMETSDYATYLANTNTHNDILVI